MAIAVYFSPDGMDAAKYDEVHRRLEAAGFGTPHGRLHHSSFGPEEKLMVYDVWESEEAFGAFGEVLIPILTDLGIDVGTPDVMPAYRVIQ